MKYSVIGYFLSEGFRNVFKNKKSTISCLGIMCVTMLMFGLFFAIGRNITHMVENIEDAQAIRAFFHEDAPEEEVTALKDQILAIDGVADVKYRNKQDAYNEIKEDLGEYTTALDGMEPDFLSYSYVITLEDLDLNESVQSEIAKLPHFKRITSNNQTINTLSNIGKWIRIITGVILVILIAISIFAFQFLGKVVFERQNPDILEDVDSQYSRIWIKQVAGNDTTYKTMQVENSLESYIDEKTGKMGAKYLYYYDLADYYLKDFKSTLMIGGAALGIIKTILEHNLELDLSKLIDETLELLPVKADVKADVEEFFVQRLIIFLNSDYSKNVLEACASKNPCRDLCDYLKRVKAISGGVDEKLVENANRVLRILKEEAGEVNESLFVLDAEKSLYKAVQGILFNGDYDKYLSDLISINPVVTKFFDDVLVMDKDEKIKNNRVALLKSLKNKYIILTDFSKL